MGIRFFARRMAMALLVFVAMAVLLSAFVPFVSAAQKARSIVVIGDGISAGKGLDDRAGKAYGSLLASNLGIKAGRYQNLAQDSMTSQALLDRLPMYETDISKADLIIISVGADDIIPFIYSAFEGVISSRVSYFQLLERMKEPGFAENFTAALDVSGILGATAYYAVNLSKIIAQIKTYNPDINIALLNLYNPVGGIAAFSEISSVIESNIGKLNEKTTSVAEEYGCHVIDIADSFNGQAERLTNITSLDISPNAEGHKIIAQLLSNYVETLPDLPDETTPPDTSEPEESIPASVQTLPPDTSDSGDLNIVVTEEPSHAVLYIAIAGGVCIIGALTVLLAVKLRRGKR